MRLDDHPDHRPNVGVVLFRHDGRVWLGRRAGAPGPDNWQFPQGGVDKGEDLEAAALRELAEETGVTSVTLLGRTAVHTDFAFARSAFAVVRSLKLTTQPSAKAVRF